MKKEIRKENSVISLRILVLIIIIETFAFIGYAGCNLLFVKDYQNSIDKARYVDKNCLEEFYEWQAMQ